MKKVIFYILPVLGGIVGCLIGGWFADLDSWKRKTDREVQYQIKVDLKHQDRLESLESRVKALEVPRLPLIIE